MLFFRRRLRADFSQMFALVVGVLVMTAILAGAPMYLGTIESLGLRSTLDTLSAEHRNLQIEVEGLPLTRRAVSAATERVDVALDELGDLVVHVGQSSHTRDHFWAVDAEGIVGGPTADMASLQRFEGFLDESTITEGRAATATVRKGEDFLLAEVMVPAGRAELLGVHVGDGIWLSPSPSDPPYLFATVVGLFEPNDLEVEFWHGLGDDLMEPRRPAPTARYRLPIFFVGDGLFNAVTGGRASIGLNRWLVQLDLDQLERQSPAITSSQIDSVGHQLRRGLPEAKALSALGNRLEALAEKISFARIPTLMMGGVLLLAAGYYAIMAGGALVARRRVDTTRLMVRGSGRGQISLMFFFEASFLVLLPAVVAPFLAVGVVSAIGLMPEYESITLGSGMPVYLTWQAFAWSFAGAALVLGYMQLITLKNNGREISSAQLMTLRVEGKPFYQRQHLDMLFFLFGGVILWDLTTESSVVTEGADQAITVNPLLVFAPAIFLAVAVMFSLRVLPPLARFISNGLARRGPVWSHLISALFARVPLTYAWPAAILGMAAGTAMLSATVAATLQQSAVDQSGYEVGADLRIFPVDLNSGPRTSVLDDVRLVEGVGGVSAGLRTTGDIRIGGRGVPFEFLAIEPDQFAEIGEFRSDFALTPVNEILGTLAGTTVLEPLVVPESADRIGFRMRANAIVQNIRASIRLLDANGLSHSVNLGPVSSFSWQVRMGKIPLVAERPVEIVGLTFFELTPDELGTPVSVQIDDIMYESAGTADLIVLETFGVDKSDRADVWQPLASSEGIDTSANIFEYRTVGDLVLTVQGLQVDLGVGTDIGVRGVVRSDSESGAVPALFSETALESNTLSVGDTTVVHVFNRSVPVKIMGVTEYFPTMNPESGGFVVADISQLWRHLSLSSSNSAGVAAEIFVGLNNHGNGEVIDAIANEVGGLHSIVDRDELRELSVVTPLAVAGWRGASIITAILAVGLAVLGFLTFVPMRPAGDRFNLAVLRTLGVRKRGLVFISVIEQLVVLAVGVAAGVGVGLIMARLAVDTASQTDSNIGTLPPIVFSTNWNYIGSLVIALAVMAVVILVFDVISVRRVNIAATVRASGKSG